ncbi:MAG: Glu/Leu/Phe/Val dehydrogenase dimerization domain-containing protein [Phycisphaerales bacterium]
MNLPATGFHESVTIGGETFPLLAVSRHGSCTAMTAVHSKSFPHSLGGARFREASSLEEVAHLASAMTVKCLAAEIPAGGQKSVLVVPAGVPSIHERAALLASHIDFVRSRYPGAIFGPDMNNPEAVLDQVARSRPDLVVHLAGLSRECNGLSIDANGYTAQGLVQSIRVWQEVAHQRFDTACIQGFGAVGAHAARLLHGIGMRVRAVSNRLGCAASRAFSGLDIPAFFAAWHDGGDEGVAHHAQNNPNSVLWENRPDAVFDRPADVVVFAAGTSCFGVESEIPALRSENANVADVAELLKKTSLKFVAEGANHPLSTAAESFLELRGIAVPPDFIVNCAGVIGCWVEWKMRSEGKEVGDAGQSVALEHVRRVIDVNTRLLAGSHRASRAAAMEIANYKREMLTVRCLR